MLKHILCVSRGYTIADGFITKELYDQIDQDRDGVISYYEFSKWHASNSFSEPGYQFKVL